MCVFFRSNYTVCTYRQNHSTGACDLIHKKRKDVWERILFNELKIISYSYALCRAEEKYMLWFFMLPSYHSKRIKAFWDIDELTNSFSSFTPNSQWEKLFFFFLRNQNQRVRGKINRMTSNWNQRLCIAFMASSIWVKKLNFRSNFQFSTCMQFYISWILWVRGGTRFNFLMLKKNIF